MSTLYLHIGMPKAGSSSIQAAFYSARRHLRGKGVGYLDLASTHARVLLAILPAERKPPSLHKKTNRKLGLDARASGYDADELLQKIEHELASNQNEKFVISGERLFTISRSSVEFLKEFFGRFFSEVRIIVYVREPVSWATSWAQHRVAHSKQTLDQLYDTAAIAGRVGSIVPVFRENLEPYIEVFGRGAVDIRVFDRRSFVGGDLIQDFCAAIGEPGLGSELIGDIRNAAMSHEAVLLMNAINAGHERRQRRAHRGELLGFRRRLEMLQGSRFSLPKDIALAVREAAAEDVGWLRAAAGSMIFDDAPAPSDDGGRPAWSDATLRQLGSMLEESESGPASEHGAVADPLRTAVESLGLDPAALEANAAAPTCSA